MPPEAIWETTKIILFRSWDIVRVPFSQLDMLWIISPLVITMVLTALYFGRYEGEELGWNTAFGNSMVLVFVSVDLLRHLYTTGELFSISAKSALVAAVIIEGIFLSIFSFFHVFSESFAFGIGSGITINMVALFVIILVYSSIPFDFITLGAVSLLSFILYGFLKILQTFEVKVETEDKNEGTDLEQ